MALALLWFGLVGSSVYSGQKSDSLVDEVLRVNGQLSIAARTGDTDTLAGLLSKELVVSDPSNTIRRRDDLLALFATKAVEYRSFESTIDYAGEIGGLVVLMGTESTVLESAPKTTPWKPGTKLHRRFTNVFRQEGETWRLLVKQSTVFSVEEP